jgi:hypothetical protein
MDDHTGHGNGLIVTDGLQQGDEFELFDIGASIGSTSANADDPDHTNRVGARDADAVV